MVIEAEFHSRSSTFRRPRDGENGLVHGWRPRTREASSVWGKGLSSSGLSCESWSPKTGELELLMSRCGRTMCPAPGESRTGSPFCFWSIQALAEWLCLLTLRANLPYWVFSDSYSSPFQKLPEIHPKIVLFQFSRCPLTSWTWHLKLTTTNCYCEFTLTSPSPIHLSK